MSLRHQPVRTCIGCRSRDDQANLVRWSAVNRSGVTVAEVDHRRQLAGRGAWLHPRPSCVELALKRKAFNRAFRGVVDSQSVEQWLHTLRGTS
ncbi:YlxR family protein [Arthrobacter sp. Soil782]|uniref:YlxR family protein n=1 Tax=Arthrobacter sp. Soil782 TaxID=1736410 RepID=UPI0009E9228D|nr:YlxR family protein [Arthrobacter sp. Soil782]